MIAENQEEGSWNLANEETNTRGRCASPISSEIHSAYQRECCL